MDIRNLMEDKVLQVVNEVCDEDETRKSNRYCTSSQCRLDAACFVLNRIPQKYVTSGRGFAYLETDLFNNPQIQVDIVALVHEGLRRVTEIQRSFYAKNDELDEQLPPGTVAAFYFPTIKGRLFNGITFEPITDVTIRILQNEQMVDMVDGRWPNPYTIVGNTPGTYLFWPKPKPAKKIDEEMIFEFNLEVMDERYEPFHHFFTFPVRSVAPIVNKTYIRDYTVSDLFLLPRYSGDNDMQLNPIDPELNENLFTKDR